MESIAVLEPEPCLNDALAVVVVVVAAEALALALCDLFELCLRRGDEDDEASTVGTGWKLKPWWWKW